MDQLANQSIALFNRLTTVAKNLYRDDKGNAVQVIKDYAHPRMPCMYKITFTNGNVFHHRNPLVIIQELKL